MIDTTIVSRLIATTALAFGVSGSAAVAQPPAVAQEEARCPYQQRDMIDADVIQSVPATRTRTIWL